MSIIESLYCSNSLYSTNAFYSNSLFPRKLADLRLARFYITSLGKAVVLTSLDVFEHERRFGSEPHRRVLEIYKCSIKILEELCLSSVFQKGK